jgi:hypothetical protein
MVNEGSTLPSAADKNNACAAMSNRCVTGTAPLAGAASRPVRSIGRPASAESTTAQLPAASLPSHRAAPMIELLQLWNVA